MGYAGGKKENPVYRSLGDHAETVQIDYDPAGISFSELLDIFWKSHSPTRQSWSRQYTSAIFYHNEEQKLLAEESRSAEEKRRNSRIYTQILPYTGFYLAEDYHQKYRLRQHPDLMREFREMYPDISGIVNSTAAARVNGYLDGYGTAGDLRKFLNLLGLSQEGRRSLLDSVSPAISAGCPIEPASISPGDG